MTYPSLIFISKSGWMNEAKLVLKTAVHSLKKCMNTFRCMLSHLPDVIITVPQPAIRTLLVISTPLFYMPYVC
jgi:hypothetical protein